MDTHPTAGKVLCVLSCKWQFCSQLGVDFEKGLLFRSMKIGALVIDILYLVATNDVNLGMLGAEASSVGEEDKYSLDCPPIELQSLEDILSQNTRGLTWTQKCVLSKHFGWTREITNVWTLLSSKLARNGLYNGELSLNHSLIEFWQLFIRLQTRNICVN